MGYQLVARAIEHALPHLPPAQSTAARLLIVMAQSAKDTDTRPWSSRGDAFYATRLGCADGGDQQSAERVVRRARRVLLDAGFIEPWPTPRATSKIRRWVLTLPDGLDFSPDANVR